MPTTPTSRMVLSPSKANVQQQQQRKRIKKRTVNNNGTTNRSCHCDCYLMIPVTIAAWFLFLDWSQRLFELQQPPPLPENHMLQSVPPPALRRMNNNQTRQAQQSYYYNPHFRRVQRQKKAQQMNLLYILTSSNEYNTGAKATRSGQDRFLDIVVPVIIESVSSLMTTFGHVDVYLLLGYTLRKERQAILEKYLKPMGVGLQVWHDATPIHYDYITRTAKLGYVQERDKILARQHRYVVKDKLPYYDFVLAFEDDMLIKNHHVLYHMEFMEEIRRLKQSAPTSINNASSSSSSSTNLRSGSGSKSLPSTSHSHSVFWGALTVDQLNHIRPGLLRVEVLTNGTLNQQEYQEHYETQQHQPFRLAIDTRAARSVNTHPCCHRNVSRALVSSSSSSLLEYPTADQVMVWETAIAGMSVRQMPEPSSLLDWVALLPIKGQSLLVPGYWSGTHGTLGPNQTKKPSSLLNEYMAQSAGWMASRQEIMDYQVKLCHGTSSFVPPFEAPYVQDDGLSFFADSVEYWSGGLQLWGQQCTIQRLVAVQPELFSKHLIYHTANNKQKELPPERFTKTSTLLGQLHTVVQAARQEQFKLKNAATTTKNRRRRHHRYGDATSDEEEEEEEFRDHSWLYQFLDGIRHFVSKR